MLWMGKVDSSNAETVKLKLSLMPEEIRPFVKSIMGIKGKNFLDTST